MENGDGRIGYINRARLMRALIHLWLAANGAAADSPETPTYRVFFTSAILDQPDFLINHVSRPGHLLDRE